MKNIEGENNFTPDEIEKLNRVKTERTEDVLPRELFKELAKTTRVVGAEICEEFALTRESPFRPFYNSIYGKSVPDTLSETIATGITAKESRDQYWAAYDAKKYEGEPVVIFNQYAGITLEPPEVISLLLLNINREAGEGKSELWEKSYQIADTFARKTGFIDKDEIIDRENPHVSFLRNLYLYMGDDPVKFNKPVFGGENDPIPDIPHILPSTYFFNGKIEIPHLQLPFTLSMRTTDQALKDGYEGMPQYQGMGVGVDLLTVKYTPKE